MSLIPVFIPGYAALIEVMPENPLEHAPKNVTIWVHGTRLNLHFPLNLVPSLVSFDSHINPTHSGLHLIADCAPDNNLVTVATTLNSADSIRFPLDHFYTFGWSGKLSHTERLKAAKDLETDIVNKIINPYTALYGTVPKITIIAHSHGGNVALNMARTKTLPFVIDQLILLACPVQSLTHKLTKSSLFTKVYSLFSDNDMLQVMDPQIVPSMHKTFKNAQKKSSMHPIKKWWQSLAEVCFFSQRKFSINPKLTQINVSWDKSEPWDDADLEIYGELKSIAKTINSFQFFKKRGLTHIEFLIPSFLRRLPEIMSHPFKVEEICSFTL
jgi:hypothetical protein